MICVAASLQPSILHKWRDLRAVQEPTSHASLRRHRHHESSPCAFLDCEISNLEAHVCLDKTRMHTIDAQLRVLLCKDPGEGIHKSLGHFVCNEPSFRRPSATLQLLTILEVHEEQFGQLIQSLFRQAVDVV